MSTKRMLGLPCTTLECAGWCEEEEEGVASLGEVGRGEEECGGEAVCSLLPLHRQHATKSAIEANTSGMLFKKAALERPKISRRLLSSLLILLIASVGAWRCAAQFYSAADGGGLRGRANEEARATALLIGKPLLP